MYRCSYTNTPPPTLSARLRAQCFLSVCVLCGSPVWHSPPVVGPLWGPPLCVGPLCGSPVRVPCVGPLCGSPLCGSPVCPLCGSLVALRPCGIYSRDVSRSFTCARSFSTRGQEVTDGRYLELVYVSVYISICIYGHNEVGPSRYFIPALVFCSGAPRTG